MQENQSKLTYESPQSKDIKLASKQMICWSNEDPDQDPI